MNIKQGVKGTFGKQNFHAFLKILGGGLLYLAAPTALNVNGTGGALLGVGTSTLFAILFNQPMLAAGGWLAMTLHSIYIYVNPWLEQSVGRPIFGWSQAATISATTTTTTTTTGTGVRPTTGLRDGYAQIQGIGSLQPGSAQLQLTDGRDIVGYPGMNDIPSVEQNGETFIATLNDIPSVTQNQTMILEW